jgi:hypothetical protein
MTLTLVERRETRMIITGSDVSNAAEQNATCQYILNTLVDHGIGELPGTYSVFVQEYEVSRSVMPNIRIDTLVEAGGELTTVEGYE